VGGLGGLIAAGLRWASSPDASKQTSVQLWAKKCWSVTAYMFDQFTQFFANADTSGLLISKNGRIE
jgi:hypothetical protein